MITKHDQRRIESISRQLHKVHELLGVAELYLTVNERDQKAIYAVQDSQEHVTIALEKLKPFVNQE